MKRDRAEVIEIPQTEPDKMQKLVFWMAVHRKEAMGAFLGFLFAAGLLIFWQTPSSGLSNRLSTVHQELSQLSVDQWDSTKLKKLQQLSSRLGALQAPIQVELLQKQLLSKKEDLTHLNTNKMGEGVFREFSETSLLLAQNKQALALEKAQALQNKLVSSTDESSLALIPYNLFRLFQIYEKLGEKEKAQSTLISLNAVLTTPAGQAFAAQFSQGGVSLADWLKERETR